VYKQVTKRHHFVDFRNMNRSETYVFVRNLIMHTNCGAFYYDDVTVSSFIDIKYTNVAVEGFSKEQRDVIDFLWVKGLGPNAIRSL